MRPPSSLRRTKLLLDASGASCPSSDQLCDPAQSSCVERRASGARRRSARMDVQVKVDKKGANPANAGSKGMRSLFGTRGADNPPPVKLTDKAKSAIFGKRDDGPSSNSPAVEPPAATDTEERRVDPADGNAYTRQEFIDEYGGTAEWDQAAGSQ